MTDVFDEETRSHVMRQVGSSDTGPEMKLRRALWHAGYRYRVDFPVADTRPDIVFREAKVAVFVDGCFWHGCPEHGAVPESNRDYWTQELERNRERDEEDRKALEAEDWTVVRIWEHEVDEKLPQAAEKVAEAVHSRREEG